MSKKTGFIVRAAAAGLLALTGIAASAGGASAGTVGSCTATGKTTQCAAQATLGHPKSISMTVTASPNQELAFGYDVVCSLGGKSKLSEQAFTLETPVTVSMKLPYAHPDSCHVSATADNAIIVESAAAGRGLTPAASGKGWHVVISSPAVAAPLVRGSIGGCVNDRGDSSANGTPIVLWSCNGSGPQDWTYTKDKLVHNGRCLTDPKSAGAGTRLILNACSPAANDLWVHKASGEYVLAAQAGKLCLTAPARPNGTQLTVAACKNTAGQHWTLP